MGYRERDRERYLSSSDSLSKSLQQPRLGQAKATSQALHLGLPHGWQEPKDLGRYLMPPRSVLGELDWKWRWDLIPGTSIQHGCPKQWLDLLHHSAPTPSSPSMQRILEFSKASSAWKRRGDVKMETSVQERLGEQRCEPSPLVRVCVGPCGPGCSLSGPYTVVLRECALALSVLL